jgi:hypothetical protein
MPNPQNPPNLDPQVKQIIQMLDPETPGTQTDAVFLVQKYIQTTNETIKNLRKQLAMAEADRDAKAQEKHDAINAKLASEADMQGKIDDLHKQVGKAIPAPTPIAPSGGVIDEELSGVPDGG